MSKKKKLRSIAFHEAGHAVVAYLTGSKMNEVSIVVDDESGRGYTDYDGPIDSIPTEDIASGCSLEIRQICEEEVINILAGPLAESLFCPRCFRFLESKKDLEDADAILIRLLRVRALNPDDEEKDPYRKWLEARAMKFLKEPRVRHSVKTFAEILFDRGSISGGEAESIIDQAYASARVPSRIRCLRKPG